MIIDLQHRGISILNESALTDFIDKHLELKAERDQALEVVREYRKRRGRYDHGRDCLGPAECGVVDDDRCPTCIKADALRNQYVKESGEK